MSKITGKPTPHCGMILKHGPACSKHRALMTQQQLAPEKVNFLYLLL